MNMYEKIRIEAYLTGLERSGVLDAATRLHLRGLLYEPQNTVPTVSPPGPTLWEAVRTRLRLTRSGENGAGGITGKLDNLLLLLRGFAIFFTLTAVIPVAYIYWHYTWILPVAALIPLLHCYAAWLGTARPEKRNVADSLHVAAGAISIVPLLLVIAFLANTLGSLFVPPAAIPVAWLLHAGMIGIRVRTPNAFFLAVWVAVLCANALMIIEGHGARLLAVVNSFAALCFVLLPHWAPPGRIAGKSAVCRSWAVLLTVVALFLACGAWMARSKGHPVGEDAWIVPVYLASLPFLVAAHRLERGRIVGGRTGVVHFTFNAAATWLLVLFVLCGLCFMDLPCFSINLHGTNIWGKAAPVDIAFVCAVYALILSWSAWLCIVQARNRTTFNPSLFDLGTFGLLGCGIVFFVALLWLGWWLPCLGLGLAALRWSRRAEKAMKQTLLKDIARDMKSNTLTE